MERIKNFNESFDRRIENNIKNYMFSFNNEKVIDIKKIEEYKRKAFLYFMNDLIKHLQVNPDLNSYVEKESRTIDNRTIGEFYADFIFRGWVCEDFFVEDMKKYSINVELNGNDRDRDFSLRPSTNADFKISNVPYEYQVSVGSVLKLKEDKLKGLLRTKSYLLGKTKNGYLVISAKDMKSVIKEKEITYKSLYGPKYGWELNFNDLENFMFDSEESLKKEFLRVTEEVKNQKTKEKKKIIKKNKLIL